MLQRDALPSKPPKSCPREAQKSCAGVTGRAQVLVELCPPAWLEGLAVAAETLFALPLAKGSLKTRTNICRVLSLEHITALIPWSLFQLGIPTMGQTLDPTECLVLPWHRCLEASRTLPQIIHTWKGLRRVQWNSGAGNLCPEASGVSAALGSAG